MNNQSSLAPLSLAALFGPQCWFMLRDSPRTHMLTSVLYVERFGQDALVEYSAELWRRNGKYRVGTVAYIQDRLPTRSQVHSFSAGNRSTPNYSYHVLIW